MSTAMLVLLKLAAAVVPLLTLAWTWRVYPRSRMVGLALAPALATFLLPLLPEARWPLLAIDAVLVVLLAVDATTLPAAKSFSVERAAGRVASLKQRHPVSLTLFNHARRTFDLSVRDGVPHELRPEPPEFDVRIPPRSRMPLDYLLRPARRGAFTLSPVHLRVQSRLGFWQRLIDRPAETLIHVYPDMQQLGQYALLARTNRLSLMGVRRVRRVGQDHDFERLRDYTIDDNYKHIEWRATARRQRLTVKDFQSSQSQRIMFLVDCGRMMTNESAGLSLLDHALNAMLMLSYVALRQGDSVGLIAFSDEIHGHVPARGGMHQMNRLLHLSFDRFPRLVESRFDLAFRHLASRSRRRSLVVLITNLIDEVNSHQIEQYLANLVGRHLPLGVLLRDRRMFDAAGVENPEGQAFWQAAAAAEILTWRHQVLTDLTSKGVLALDVFPEEMTAPLVNRYLEIKARHLL